ncbi:MAG: DUF2911 domain-containing protein [Bacteroidota bacterium]
MKNLVLLAALVAVCTLGAHAQIVTPQPSPSATLTQTVGLTEVTIEYSRPSLRGREGMGKLVPYGAMWRTGANASTKITFSDNVMLGGEEIPAGKYALYTIPGENEWTIVVHKNLTHWGVGNYDESEDLARFVVKSMELPMKYETFTIDVHSFMDNKASISLMWDNTGVNIPLEVSYKDQVMASIERTLAGPSSGDLANAATFYLNNGEDLEQAMDWITKAIELRPEAFWYVHTQAKIYLELGDKQMAKEAAMKSKEMAAAAPNDFGYVANNEMLLEKIQ